MSAPLTVPELVGLQTSKYFNVVAMAIWMYDYAITLDQEVKWVWGRRWDITRFIFTVCRYLPFVGVGLGVYPVARSQNQLCTPYSPEADVSIIAAELLMVLRTYAFWGGDKRILYGLIIYGSITIGATSVTSDVPNKNLIPGVEPIGSECNFEESRNTTFWYAFLCLFEIVILILNVYRQFHAYRGESNAIVRALYNDGILYMISIISISVAYVVVLSAIPIQYSNLLETLQFVLHGVLASRILFNLRKESHRTNSGGTDHSSTQFLTTIEYDAPLSSAEPTGVGQEVIELVRPDVGPSYGDSSHAEPFGSA